MRGELFYVEMQSADTLPYPFISIKFKFFSINLYQLMPGMQNADFLLVLLWWWHKQSDKVFVSSSPSPTHVPNSGLSFVTPCLG